jgi:hypothetical protein
MRKWASQKTGEKSPDIGNNKILDVSYNGDSEYSICTEKAKALGYRFAQLKSM